MTPESKILASLTGSVVRCQRDVVKASGLGYLCGTRAIATLVQLQIIECIAYRSSRLYRLAMRTKVSA